jgi:hypothetical protein
MLGSLVGDGLPLPVCGSCMEEGKEEGSGSPMRRQAPAPVRRAGESCPCSSPLSALTAPMPLPEPIHACRGNCVRAGALWTAYQTATGVLNTAKAILNSVSSGVKATLDEARKFLEKCKKIATDVLRGAEWANRQLSLGDLDKAKVRARATPSLKHNNRSTTLAGWVQPCNRSSNVCAAIRGRCWRILAPSSSPRAAATHQVPCRPLARPPATSSRAAPYRRIFSPTTSRARTPGTWRAQRITWRAPRRQPRTSSPAPSG